MSTTQTNTQRLVASVALLTAAQEFKVGDVIVWKGAEFANRRMPEVGQPVVVSRVFDVPLFEEARSAGTPIFNEPLDIAVAIIDSDGDLMEFHFDSRRYRLATQEEIAAWDAMMAQEADKSQSKVESE